MEKAIIIEKMNVDTKEILAELNSKTK
uniref:Uncharacterized protein n=1 Tax=Romanomermis culicivorax TaxID=13658 RepID=A0A915KAZ0_ROMCU